MTKVTIINGSPRLEKSNTTFILHPFIKGLEEAGAAVQLIYLRKLKINPCIGCFKCWGETIGECFQKDDMKELLNKLKQSDILVIATPVHAPLTGYLQNTINRLVPLIEPILELRDGRTRAKPQDDVKFTKIVGVITGGWCELANLDVVAKVIEELTELFSFEIIEPVLRPHGNRLRSENELNKQIFQRLEKVGYDLIKEGKYVRIRVSDDGEGMSNDTVSKIFEPFFTTKPVGKGSGLGLSQVYGIARQHHGYIFVQSEINKGTEINLFFPGMKENKIKQ